MSVLDVEIKDGVALLSLNRPEKRNAINPEMMVRLADTWDHVRSDDAVRVAVVTGAGEDTFSAGGDLRSLVPLLTRARPPGDEWDERLLADQRTVMNTAMLRTDDFPKPIISAVNGACYAGGMELVLATDIRVAGSHSRFALSEVQRGIIPGGGSVARLPRQIPWAVAMEVLTLGDPISADRAYEVGMVNAVVPPGSELRHAMRMAERIANNAPLAVRAVKGVATSSLGLPLRDAFLQEDDAVRLVMRSADAKEGARAFSEHRPPTFRGL